ncbi:hypothetical protein KXW04_003647 [Aspergillus fumigatus]|nr:hypothetical protein KXX27_007964 [Aspergillus fumigatus]KAH1900899.1 hypothetical protein KXW04_003647 [Aspergillus fumigatus]KAH2622145.1 hypothetical protein KXV20_002183 [Aspergillus fumigatus]KAH3115271.1 hypothetical protein KXW11_002151 [Aspergillus fumigatus]KAH3394103.1 hypothetical protein KXW79_002103 [Aspergillus fumigatus]
MSAKHEPSLLDYARFHGIAHDYTAINPSQHPDHSLKLPPDDPPVENKLKLLDEYLVPTQESDKKAIFEEKLNVRKGDSRFLSAVLQDMRTHAFDLNVGDHLAAFNRLSKLKIEPPIFSLNYETHSALPQRPVLYNLQQSNLRALEEAPEYRCEPLVKKADEINEEMRNEKLNCNRKSFVLVQDAMKLGNVSSHYLDDILAHAIQPINSVPALSPALAPLDVSDLAFSSPSPEPELQMLPSPASTEILETSKPQNHQSKDPDASHGPYVLERVQRTSKGGAGGMMQIDRPLSAAERLQIWDHAATVGVTEPCESTAFAAEEGRSQRNSQDIQLQANLIIQKLDNHDEQPASHSAPLAERKVSEKEHEWLVTETPVKENTAVVLQSRPASISPSTTCYSSHTNDAAFEASIQCSNNDSGESDTHHSAPDPHASSTQEQANRKSVSNITVEGGIVSTNQNVPTLPVLDSQIVSKQGQPTSRIQQSNISAFMVGDSDLTAATQTRLQTNTPATVFNQHLQQRKRKRQLTNKSFVGSSQSEQQEQQRQVRKPSFTTVGSLAAFMETRGRNEMRNMVTQSPYFPAGKSTDDVSKRQSDEVSIEKPESCLNEPNKSENVSDIVQTATQLPRFQQQTGEQPILFLSTTLLKSHLRLVRCLEGMAGLPVIVYRDYNQETSGSEPRGKHTTSSMNNNPTHQIEADIIISPSTGLVLTTSQAATQLYLPGHKSTHPETNTECINSPLRERIFLLAPRYERIYLFICHSAPSPKESQGKQSGPTADKRLLASIASLTAFCNSMSAYATINPLLAPSSPETAAGWILSLANKHIARLPENPTRIPPSTSFTPINSPQKNRLRPEIMMRTTVWELFLRQAALNPYAAQLILAFIKREDEEERTYIRYASPKAASSSSVEDGGTHGLARFIEMEPDRRKEVFGQLIGDRMMGRINHILDKDWQCDWVLNFDVDTEL